MAEQTFNHAARGVVECLTKSIALKAAFPTRTCFELQSFKMIRAGKFCASRDCPDFSETVKD
jgi:hypothetical protein